MARSIEDLRSSVRAIDRQLEKMRLEAAILTGIIPLPEDRVWWSTSEINWEDPRLSHMKDNYQALVDKRYNINYEAERKIAIRDDNLPRFEAREIAYGWLHMLGEGGNDWLIEHHLTTVSLTERILENPRFLEEVCL